MPELLAQHATRDMMRAIAILVTVVGLLVSGSDPRATRAQPSRAQRALYERTMRGTYQSQSL
jgi:hypothetical protein